MYLVNYLNILIGITNPEVVLNLDSQLWPYPELGNNSTSHQKKFVLTNICIHSDKTMIALYEVKTTIIKIVFN